VSLVRSGDYTTAEAAELFGVARSTVYWAVQREQSRACAQSGVAFRAG
jgi:excisionase family DNA binding protein